MRILKLIFWGAVGSFVLLIAVMVIARIPGDDGLSGDDKEIIKMHLSAEFRDPTSVLVTKLWVSETTYSLFTICGQVNGKNAYGAYVGAQPYTGLYDKHEKRFEFIIIANSEKTATQMIDKCVAETIASEVANRAS